MLRIFFSEAIILISFIFLSHHTISYADPIADPFGRGFISGAANLVGAAADAVAGAAKKGTEIVASTVGSGVTTAGSAIGTGVDQIGKGVTAVGDLTGSTVLIGGAGSIISTAGSITQSGAQIAGGIITVLPKHIPLPSDLFRLSFDLLVGVPVATMYKLLNAFCSAAISSETLQPKYLPNLDFMKFQLHSLDGNGNQINSSVPIKESGKLFTHPQFNPNFKTVILATGWTTSVNGTNNGLNAISRGYLCRGGYNFIVVDASNFLQTLYTWSAFNTEVIGEYVALGVKNLVDSGYPLENIHLIGHSLGAHIVGSAGKHFFLTTNKFIHRITGLDPALPCFNEGENLNQLDRGDALFVDVIHSNSGVLGQRLPVGDADYYPNGLTKSQPGCFDSSCSHARAYEYYAESIYPGNENGFMAVRCTSLNKLEANYCTSPPVPMGFAAIPNIKGNFFLRTRSSSPFGLNSSNKNLKCS